VFCFIKVSWEDKKVRIKDRRGLISFEYFLIFVVSVLLLILMTISFLGKGKSKIMESINGKSKPLVCIYYNNIIEPFTISTSYYRIKTIKVNLDEFLPSFLESFEKEGQGLCDYIVFDVYSVDTTAKEYFEQLFQEGFEGLINIHDSTLGDTICLSNYQEGSLKKSLLIPGAFVLEDNDGNLIVNLDEFLEDKLYLKYLHSDGSCDSNPDNATGYCVSREAGTEYYEGVEGDSLTYDKYKFNEYFYDFITNLYYKVEPNFFIYSDVLPVSYVRLDNLTINSACGKEIYPLLKANDSNSELVQAYKIKEGSNYIIISSLTYKNLDIGLKTLLDELKKG
jgi:hypothetical protein